MVRAGSNGMFYYAFIAFKRGDKGQGTIGLARFIDDNNEEKVTGDPIRYLDTSVVDAGTRGLVFHDKPWLAVGLPQAGGPQCMIPASGATPAQSFPASPIYVAYSTFLANETVSKLHVATSNDCGQTWSNPVTVSQGSSLVQGAALAIDPVSGAVYLAWRQVAYQNQPNAIKIAKSTDGGHKFSNPVQIAAISPFDQGSSKEGIRTSAYPSVAVDGTGRVYVVWSDRVGPVDATGARDARIVIANSVDGATWTPPVPLDNIPANLNNPPGRGHQIMPSISVNAGKIMVLYYDLREDATAGELQCLSAACQATRSIALFDEVRNPVGDLFPSPPSSSQLAKVFGPGILDAGMLRRRHTIDVRLAQADQPASAFVPLLTLPFTSARISQYAYGTSGVPGSTKIQQLRFNVPNLPMFVQGTISFMGDYVDLASAAIVPDVPVAGSAAAVQPPPGGGAGWKFNTSPSNAVVFHAVWTDNRDVRPPRDGDWTHYTTLITPSVGPSGPVCSVGQAGSRNQNIYTSRISQGLIVSSPQNFKQLGANPLPPGQLLQRGFAVIVQNATAARKNFRLTIASQPVGGKASFLQVPVAGQPDPDVLVDVGIRARSSASRTVFVTSSDPHASVTVRVTEINTPGGSPVPGGLQDSILLNPDLTNPNLAADLTNADITSKEVYSADLSSPDLTNTTPANPDLTNPDLTNRDPANPDLTNPDLTNTDLTSFGIPNPDLTNPDLTNPDLTNPDLTNPDLTNGVMADTTFKITNTGNTAAVYKVNVLTLPLPRGFKSQLILYKTYSTPQLLDSCSIQQVTQTEVIANIPDPLLDPPSIATPDLTNPDLTNPDLTNATMVLAPGESGFATLRLVDPDRTSSPNICGGPNFPPCGANDFNPLISVKTVPVPQAISTGATAPSIPLVIIQFAMNDGVRTISYSQQIRSIGGAAPLNWTVIAGSLPPGLNLDPLTGLISGVPLVIGTYTFTVVAVDSGIPQETDSQVLTIRIFDPLVIVTSSLNDGVTGTPYSQSISVTGGFSSRTYTFSGSLPPGLSLSPTTGQIAGTPTTAGTFGFTINATDSATPPQVVSKGFTIRIATPLSIATPSLSPATFGSSYSVSLTATGGLGGLTWIVSSGALPAGINLSASGLLSGIPTATGSFSFTVRVTDSSSPALVGTKDFSLIVTLPAGATLNFLTQPSNTTAGQLITPAIQVKVQTASAIGIPGVAVTMSVNSNSFGGALTGTTTVLTDAGGVATFSNLILDKSGATYSLVASALTLSLSGAAQYILPPPTVELNALESDTQVRVFREKTGFALPAAVSVDVTAPGTYTSVAGLTPGAIPAGTQVDSYYLHADPVGAFPAGQNQTGSITFSSDILGVIVLDPTFDATDGVLGLPGTAYGINVRALELADPRDSVVVSTDRRTLNFALANSTAADDIRVITGVAPVLATTAASNNFSSSPISGFIVTVAGSAWQFPGPGPATSAPLGFGFIAGVVGDSSGNTYVADPLNHMVFRISSGGQLSIVAGTGKGGFSGDGPATSRQLNSPRGVALDAAGSLYIADTGNNMIRKVSGGNMTTVAGNGVFGFTGDNVLATTTSLAAPSGVALDAPGNLYIADTNNSRIRKVAAGIITTVAGNGSFGFTGDSVLATTTALNFPSAVLVDSTLNIYIADTNNARIRKVDSATSFISTIVGTGIRGSSPDGPALSTNIDRPRGLAFDSSGNLLFSDLGNNKIRTLIGSAVSTIAGDGAFAYAGDGGAATAASLANPNGIGTDGLGNLYIVDGLNERLRKVSGGIITTWAGNGLFKYAGDGGPAVSAFLDSPNAIALDAAGNMYVADVDNQVVRRVSTLGIITTFAGTGTLSTVLGDGGPAISAALSFPFAVAAGPGGVLYIADTFYRGRVRVVSFSGIMATTAAGFSNLEGMAVDGAGNIYVADSNANQIRKISVPSFTVTVIAGTGAAGSSGDNGPAINATLNFPAAVSVDAAGNIYVADQSNQRIRKIDTGGTITTVAGTGVAGFSGDGGQATSAQLSFPMGVAVNPAGTVLYIADTNNQRVRKVNIGGTISTFAGTGVFGYTGDNGPASNASFAGPRGVSLDAAGNVYITDTGNDRIRKVIP